MNEPIVSVIIPTFNRLVYLERTIDSVIRQTFRDFEIIVIDDGSTDETRKVLEEKYDGQIIYQWQENQGEASARNHGFSIARGKYIAFLDSDDTWCFTKLSTQVKALENPLNEGAIGTFSSCWLIDENDLNIQKKPVGRVKIGERVDVNERCTGPGMISPGSNMLIKRKYIEEVSGYDPSITRYGEDWDFLIRLCSKGRLIYIDEPLTNYRIHRDTQQRTTPKVEDLSIFLEDMLKVIQKNANLLFEGNLTRFNQVQAGILEKVGAWCFVRESWDQGNGYLIRSSGLFRNNNFRSKVASRIGYCKALILLEELCSTKLAEDYMINNFLPKIVDYWPSFLNQLPKNKLMGVFYQTMAFNLDSKEKKTIRKLCLKSIITHPRFLFSPKTIQTLILGCLK